MATVRERTTKAGEATFQVLYRHGTKQPSMTFDSRQAADEVVILINTFGPDRALKMLAAEEAGHQLTVEQLAEKFLANKADDVTERTMVDYRRDIENWVLPYLGHQAAEHVDERDVQEWIEKIKATKKLAPKSIADKHMLLHSMYQFGKAKSRKLVTHNPCLETELPKRTKKPPKGTTVPEYRAIRESAGRRNPDADDLICFLGETGWRFSEGTALDVREVEDDGTDVWVTVSQVFRLDSSYRQVIAEDEAKSWRAFRRIRLFPESAAVVRRRVVGKRPGDLVFLNSRGRPWNQNTFLRETWPRILKDAGLLKDPAHKPTPHWLRHMHVAVLGAAGAPMQEIQRRIGHESIQTTIDVYGGMIGDVSNDALGKGAAIMAGKRSAPGVSPAVVGQVVRELG
jgi:site-specific recombinase XerD